MDLKLTKAMKDFQWSFISLAIASLSHLLLRIVLGRELGPSGLGVYTLVFTIYIFGMQFAAFGIGAALTKYVAEFCDDLAKTKEYISSGIFGSIFAGTTMCLILFLLSGVISVNVFKISEMESLLKVTALCFPFIALNKAVLGTLNGFRSMKTFAILDISLNTAVFFTSVFCVLYFGMGVLGAILGFVIPTIVLGIISIFFIRSNIILKNNLLYYISSFRHILYFGFYAVLGNSIGYIYAHVDSLMIGYYLNENGVGYYAVATIFIQAIILTPSAVQRVTNPAIAKNYAKNEYESILKLIKIVIVRVFLISLLVSIFLVVFGKTFISIVFGDVFLPAYQPLMILLIGYTVYSTFMSIGTFYASTGYVNLSYKISLFSAILSISLNVLFIPKYDIFGAAMATSISLVIMTCVHFLLIRHFLNEVFVVENPVYL